MSKTCEISVTVNGTTHRATVEPRLLLTDFVMPGGLYGLALAPDINEGEKAPFPGGPVDDRRELLPEMRRNTR